MPIRKNFDAAVVALHCPHPGCLHTFTQTGEEYRKAETLTCPECGGETPIDLDVVRKMHQKQLKALRQTRARLRTLGM